MSKSQILWDLFTRATPVILVYLWKKYDYKKKSKNLRISKGQSDAKASFYPQIMQLKKLTIVEESIKRIFEHTKATRFLILVGANGKHEMNDISVILARNKINEIINQKELYKHIKVDKDYRERLKRVEKNGDEWLDVMEMSRGLLKSIYYKEEVSFSVVKFISRNPIDKDNDSIVYCSIATDDMDDFTDYDKVILNKEFEIIKTALK